MATNPLIGIDLPIKVVVYEDADGKVWLAYAKPEAMIVERFGIQIGLATNIRSNTVPRAAIESR